MGAVRVTDAESMRSRAWLSLAAALVLPLALAPRPAAAEDTSAWQEFGDPTLPKTRRHLREILWPRDVAIDVLAVVESDHATVTFEARRPRSISGSAWSTVAGSLDLGAVPSECAAVGLRFEEDVSSWTAGANRHSPAYQVWLEKQPWLAELRAAKAAKKTGIERLLETCTVRVEACGDPAEARHFRVRALRDGRVIAEVSERLPIRLPDPEPIVFLPFGLVADAANLALFPVAVVVSSFIPS